MKFEWDPSKAKANIARHGVSFGEAKAVFTDLNAIELLDETTDEERWRLLGRAGSAILMVSIPSGRTGFGSFQRERRPFSRRRPILSRITHPRHRDVDGDNAPLSASQLRAMKRVAPVKRIRWQLGLSQVDFARRFEIPVGTIRDWEQGRSKPDRAAAAYLKVISNDPESVGRALGTRSLAASGVSVLASKALSNPSSITVEQVKVLAASILTNSQSASKQRKKA